MGVRVTGSAEAETDVKTAMAEPRSTPWRRAMWMEGSSITWSKRRGGAQPGKAATSSMVLVITTLTSSVGSAGGGYGGGGGVVFGCQGPGREG